jgi:two-component system, cell cycle sensor histidine kinase PleC
MRPKSIENPQYEAARISKRRIAAFCVAIMVAICVLVVQAVVKERKSAFDHMRIEAANLSAGFEEQVRGTLNGVAGLLKILKDRIEADGAAFDVAAWSGKVSELTSPAVEILITDSDGKVRTTTASYDGASVNRVESDYYRAHRDNPNLGFFIGQPVTETVTKRLVIPATRRLETKDGQFDGVLVVLLDPEILTALHREVDLGKTSTINLLGNDGTLLARYNSANGLDTSQIGVKAQALMAWSGAALAEFSSRCPIDGLMRLHSWRRVKGYPLFVIVALGEAEALAGVNRQAWIIIGLGIAALSLLLIMMFILNREISRRLEHAIALDKESKKVRIEHRALLTITEELEKERTKLHKTNAELSTARRRAEEASGAKSAFLANMSHELRTPLNAILGYSEVIRDKILGNDPDRHVHYAADIHRSGAHLLNIVNDVLDVAKIEAGKLELCEQQLDLDEILQGSLIAVEQQASASNVHLTIVTSDFGVFISGDKTKLKQVVINLLSNAIKFTPPGGSVRVTVAADVDGGVNLSIRDTGIGMSREEIRHALNLFCQVDNRLSKRFDGTGLGLPLAVRLTELHGGTVTIESTPGSGTTVVVWLPANRITWDRTSGSNRANVESTCLVPSFDGLD